MKHLLFFKAFFYDLYRDRRTIFKLAKKELAHEYVGHYLGVLWSLIKPLGMILTLWLVFTVGFKVGKVKDGYPFVVWLTIAQISWSFITDALSGGTQSIRLYSYIVKKVAFNISALPLIKLISYSLSHLAILIIFVITFLIFKGLNIYPFQSFYYFICSFVLIYGFTLITSSLNVFARDVSKFINLILQFGFWITPIFWDVSALSVKYQRFVKLNPVYYITEGYRDSFLFGVGFWSHPYWTLYFWTVTLFILVIGIVIFSKSKHHFADIL